MASPTVPLHPLPVRLRPLRRLTQLLAGLLLYGASMALMIRSGLGLDPWDVLHEGLTRHIPLSFGTITAITGVIVLLGWIPLRQRPGIGTVANVVLIAVAVDATLFLLPAAGSWWLRGIFLVAAIVLNGLATAAYIGARLGPGPRDGLMTGLCARTGWSIRLVRTGIEIAVLVLGFFLGGTIGIGTLLYAITIGPLAQFFVPFVALRTPAEWKTAQ
ncbi:membrane protein YczE [Crossiella sp. CA198]|uniref:membrane protein YczE n=1 Tax=Crossiella sp. CA198 TaxID=3455607 RepID=UPI003F8D877C